MSKKRPGPQHYDDAGLDLKTRQELLAYSSERFKLRREQNQHFVWWLDTVARLVLTALAAFATWTWVVFVSNLIKDARADKQLTEAVLVAVLTTTTANILGTWAIVARYVWHVPKKPTSKAPKADKAKDDDEDDKDDEDSTE